MEAKSKIDTLKAQIDGIKQDDNALKAQIADADNLIDEMKEQKNKDVKAVDEKTWKSIMDKAQKQTISKEQEFLLNSLAKIFTANEGASWDDAAVHEECFKDAGVFGSWIRKVKPEKLDKECIKGIAYRINQDGDGKPGDIQEYMCSVENSPNNIDFFPFYKLLFKLCQMSIITRKRNNFQKKQAVNQISIDQIQTDVETQATISQNLDFHKELSDEAARMRSNEITQLQEKHNQLKTEIGKIEGKDFVQDYFADLLAN